MSDPSCDTAGMNPKIGPQVGERVLVRSILSIPLPPGLPERASVLIVSWDRGYTVEFEGARYRVNATNIIQPIVTTSGEVFCPDCRIHVNLRGDLWLCPRCGFSAVVRRDHKFRR